MYTYNQACFRTQKRTLVLKIEFYNRAKKRNFFNFQTMKFKILTFKLQCNTKGLRNRKKKLQ